MDLERSLNLLRDAVTALFALTALAAVPSVALGQQCDIGLCSEPSLGDDFLGSSSWDYTGYYSLPDGSVGVAPNGQPAGSGTLWTGWAGGALPPYNWVPSGSPNYSPPVLHFQPLGVAPDSREMATVLGVTQRLNTPLSRTLANGGTPTDSTDPVRDGELVVQEIDVNWPAPGMPFEFRRTYRSRVHHFGVLGAGWDHNYNRRVLPATLCGDVDVTTGDSGRVRFTAKTASTAYVTYDAPGGVPLSLIKVLDQNSDKNIWKLRDGSGTTYTFDHRGLLSTVSDLAGNTINVEWESHNDTYFSYDTKGVSTNFDLYEDGVDLGWRVKSITDTAGRKFILWYSAWFLGGIIGPADGGAKGVDLARYNVIYGVDPADCPYTQCSKPIGWGELDSATNAKGITRKYKYDHYIVGKQFGEHPPTSYLPSDLVAGFCADACGSASDCHFSALCDRLSPDCVPALTQQSAGLATDQEQNLCIDSLLQSGGAMKFTAMTAAYHYPDVAIPAASQGPNLPTNLVSAWYDCQNKVNQYAFWQAGDNSTPGDHAAMVANFCRHYVTDQAFCSGTPSVAAICQAVQQNLFNRQLIPFCNSNCYADCSARYTPNVTVNGVHLHVYGRPEDINHNLVEIDDAQGRVVQKNSYGTDNTDPAFDKVISQQLGEQLIDASIDNSITFQYVDLKKKLVSHLHPLPFLNLVAQLRAFAPTAGTALAQTLAGGGAAPMVSTLANADQLTIDVSAFVDNLETFKPVYACPAKCVKSKPVIITPPPVFVPPPVIRIPGLGPAITPIIVNRIAANAVVLLAPPSDFAGGQIAFNKLVPVDSQTRPLRAETARGSVQLVATARASIFTISGTSAAIDALAPEGQPGVMSLQGLVLRLPPPSPGLINQILEPTPPDAKTRASCAEWAYDSPWVGTWAVDPQSPTNAVVIIDIHGVVRTQYFDDSGRLLREVNHHVNDGGAKQTTDYNYDPISGVPQGIQFPGGSRYCQESNSLANVVQTSELPAPGMVGGAQPRVRLYSFSPFADPINARPNPEIVDEIADPDSGLPLSIHYEWDAGRIVSSRVQVDASHTQLTKFDYSTSTSAMWGPSTITRPDGSVIHLDDYLPYGPRTTSVQTSAGETITTSFTYDDAGRVSTSQRRNHIGGFETSYDLGGRPTVEGQKSPSGAWVETTHKYDGTSDGPIAIVGPTSTKTIAYDSLGHPRWMAEVPNQNPRGGRATCWSFGPDGRLEALMRPEGNITNFFYDDESRLIRKETGYPATQPAWVATCVAELIKAGLPVPNTAGHLPDVQILQAIHYDTGGSPDVVTDGTGVGAQVVNDGLGRPIDVIDGMNNHHRRGYDTRGRVVWEAVMGPAAPPYVKPQAPDLNLRSMVEYRYDNLDRIVEVDRWHFTNGQWVNSARPKAVTVNSYDDAKATVSSSRDGDPALVTQVDPLGRTVSTTLPNGVAEQFVYTENGAKGERVDHTYTGADGTLKRKVEYFDDYDHVVEVDDDLNTALLINSYDDQNRLWTQSSGKLFAMYDFDAFGRRVGVHEGAGTSSRSLILHWDGNDRLSSVQDANGAVTSYGYTGLDLRGTGQHPGGATSTWNYIAGSARLHDFTDQFGTLRVFGYDNAGRVASEHWTNKDLIFGAGIDRSYTYTATGEIETASVFGNAQNPANGSKITFGYDSLGNLTTEDSSLSSMTVSRVWGPHSGPNATTFFSRGASNALATVFREFDTVGRLHKVSLNNQIQVATLQHEAGTGRIDYGTAGVSAVPQYDHRDRLLGVDVYQGQNRLASVHDGVGVDGIVRERQRQFGVASPLTDFYAVDDAGRLTDENNGITAAVGQPPSDLDDKSVRPYFDDPTARGNTFKSYSLDGLGNWLSRTNATGTSNATFTTVTGLNQYWQDPSGQTWSYVAGAASQVGSTGYQFDVLGRLSTATSRAAGTLAYTYDALGRRAFEQSTAGTTELVWDSDQIVALGAAGSASTFALRVTGEGSQQTLATAQEMGNGSLSYLHSGVDGSTFAATTDSGLREAYSYSAFGETSFFDGSGKSTSGSAIGNRFLYQGQFYDAPIAAYALRAREYLPSAGRFLSPDPTGIDGGENLYAYVLGKPLFLSDPYGLSPIRPSVGGDGLRNTWQWHLAAGYADPNSKVAIASRLPLPIAAPFAAMLHHEGRAWIAEWSGNHGEAVIQGGLAGLNLLASGLEAFTLGRLPAGSVVLAASGEEAGRRTLVEEVDRLAERAEQVHDVLDDIAQAKRTTAVLATDEGVDVVGSGTRDLSPAQREALQSGEVAAKLAGEHAEVTVITHAQNTGLTPSTLASKWDICPTCQAFIEKAGGVLNDVRSAFWPKKF